MESEFRPVFESLLKGIESVLLLRIMKCDPTPPKDKIVSNDRFCPGLAKNYQLTIVLLNKIQLIQR